MYIREDLAAGRAAMLTVETVVSSFIYEKIPRQDGTADVGPGKILTDPGGTLDFSGRGRI